MLKALFYCFLFKKLIIFVPYTVSQENNQICAGCEVEKVFHVHQCEA